MIAAQVDPASLVAVVDHLEQTRKNIFAAIKAGMLQGMEGLSSNVADKLQGTPIVSRSGALLGAILGSPKVTENADVIRGTVSSNVGRMPLGLWLEEGTSVPASVVGKLFHFTAADGASAFTHGHQAFKVAAHPFLNPSLEEYGPTILDTIQARIAEVLDAQPV